MTESKNSNVAKKLAALQLVFKQQLPDKIARLYRSWSSIDQGSMSVEALAVVHRQAHSLAGSGGTFGAMAVSRVAREMDALLTPLLKEPGPSLFIPNQIEKKIGALIVQLEQASDDWQPSTVPYIKGEEEKEGRKGNLLYLVEDDELLASDLLTKLEDADFRVRHFVELSAFEAALEEEIPAAILMDVVFKGGDIAGAEATMRLKARYKAFPPVIFISVRGDVGARLAAARAGADRYFCKPLNTEKLIQTLNGLTARTIRKPFRVLLIDDDETLLEYYSTVLCDAGMVVETLSRPLEGLDLLAVFKPDLLVLDVYMEGCSGPELAQVIRQDDAWAMMPIMFLSTEVDLNVQLEVMNLGGDDFLVKPVEASHFLSAVTARVRRARWIHRINNDLNNVLRENKFQLAAMDQHDIVSTADISGRITFINEKFCQISGYSQEELLGQNHRILKSGYHPKSFYEEMWRTISQGQVWHGVICNRKKDGGEYWVESTIVPFLDDTGKPYKYVSVRTDITELRASKERLERSQAYANVGTWDWDLSTDELYWSEQVQEMYGYTATLKLPAFENFIDIIHPDDRAAVKDAVKACLDEGVKYDVEHRVIWPDGTVHWMLERGDVLRNNDGEPLHLLGVVQDITLRKEIEQNLIEAREEADNANMAKSQFLSSMSHELRTPMNAIMGFSQLLKMEADPELTESQQENVGEIVKASGHLLDLINEILDLARIESGHIDLSIETVALCEVVAEALQLIIPLAKRRAIDISLIQDGEVIEFDQLLYQNHAVRVDRTRLRQILLNLLSNAVKYNKENGKIIIACQRAENNMTRISISDSGDGLTLEQQGQLFQAFNRLGVAQCDVEGTGIGLVISKNIVELMGGKIGVDSQPGKGSTFWFEVPSDTLLPEQEYVTEDDKSVSLSSPLGEHQYTVLYIEDNPANLRLVTQLLGRLDNVHMWSAPEPLLGLDLAAEHSPDLILLDINLPGMDGFTVLEHLRQRDETRNTPVIAISANAMPKDIARGMAAGFDDYITKPIDIQVFLHAVKAVLSGEKK